MARKPKSKDAPPPMGGNLTEEQEERALLLFHFDKLRQQQNKAAEKKTLYDAEREVLTDMFRVAKADGFTRKELVSLLEDTSALRRDLTAEEERRARLRAYVGLPAGTQLDLFQSPLEVQDEQHAQGQGYAAGLRGEPGVMPENIEPRFVQAFLRGWGKGQEELSWALSEAGRIVDRRRDTNAKSVELQPEPTDDEDGHEVEPETQIEEDVQRLTDAGWAEPTADEQHFEDAAA